MNCLCIIETPDTKDLIKDYLIFKGYKYRFITSEDDFIENIEEFDPNRIILENKYEDVNGVFILKQVLKHFKNSNIEDICFFQHEYEDLSKSLKKYLQQDKICIHSAEDFKIPENAPKTDEKEKLILFVSDDRFMHILIKDLFKTLKYDLIVASDGEEGLEKYLINLPDLVMTDIEMPKLTGLELCSMIKDDYSENRTPVIIFSSSTRPEDMQEAKKCGADGYLIKCPQLQSIVNKIEYIFANQN